MDVIQLHDWFELKTLKEDAGWPTDNKCAICGSELDHFYSDDEQEGYLCENGHIWLR